MDNSFRKAVFLDRDGVINKNRSDYVKTVDELIMYDGIANSIKRLKENGFVVVIITNQSAINRGLTSHQNVMLIHSTIQEYLKSKGTKLDGFYYCPHRPDENCNCRKPKPGLLQKARDDLMIDLKSSWMIGDRDTDVMAAQEVGCKAIKISDEVTMADAVESILNSR